MSWLDRLFGRRPRPPALEEGEGDDGATGAGREAAEPDAAAGARGRAIEQEGHLLALIGAVGEGKRIEEVGAPPFWSAIDALELAGHARLAAEWLEKFAAATPAGDVREQILERAAKIRADRGEDAEAVPHLLTLIGSASPARAVRAHFLLGEQFRRDGDLRRALRHFEAVLALDVEYPNARVRVEVLRQKLGPGAPPPPALDETLAGPDHAAPGARYRLLRELGRGATGAVYLARDVELERDVAVKLLHPHLAAAARKEAVARFFEEARVTAALRHPNIVAILDLDEAYRRLVMELGAGGTLQARLARGPLPLEVALERHVEILSALSAAHRRGVVHRDLKPANLLFRRSEGEIMLCDFGVAHLPAAGRAPSEPVGTLLYMPPEQRQGAPAAPQADLFSAALILYEMLAGSPPWDRAAALRGELPPSVFERLEVPPAIRDHLRALAAPSPRDRPSSAEALTQARALLVRVRQADDEARFQREYEGLFGSADKG